MEGSLKYFQAPWCWSLSRLCWVCCENSVQVLVVGCAGLTFGTTVCACVCVCVLGFGLCQSYASVYAGPVVGAYFARVCARVVLLAASGELPAGTSLS